MVRRIHFQDHLRGVGRLRRQPRLQTGRRAQRAAHLGRVHEAGASRTGIQKRAQLPAAGRNRHGRDRRGNRRAGHAELSQDKVRSEVFIAGSQPLQICHIHGNGRTLVSSWDPVQQQAAPAGAAEPESSEVAAVQSTQPAQPRRPIRQAAPRSIPVTPQPAQQPEPENEEEGSLGPDRG